MHLFNWLTCFTLYTIGVSAKVLLDNFIVVHSILFYFELIFFRVCVFVVAGNFRSSAQALRTKYLERTQQTQEVVKHLLEYSKRDIWRCDPNHYTIGTYEEVTNFLQGYLDNEVNLNPDGTCQNTCTDYTLSENYRCYDGTYCAQKPEGTQRDHAVCKGKVVNCEFLGSDLNICSSVRVGISESNQFLLTQYMNVFSFV